MATRGSKSVTLAPHLTLKWSWETKSRNIVSKVTTISWKAEVIADESGSIKSFTSIPWAIVGTYIPTNTTLVSESGTGYLQVDANETRQIASGTFDVATSCSFRFTLDYDALNTLLGYLATNNYIEGSFALDPYPQGIVILSAPNFTDEGNPVIKYSIDSDAVTDITAKLKVGTYTVTRTIDASGEYTFALTEAERNGIRGQVTKSIYGDATFTVSARLYNQSISDSLTSQVEIINAAPVLAPTYAINGNYTYILAEQNSINVACNATPLKGATIVSYSIICGSKQIKAATGTFTDISSNIISFTATDSRGIQSGTSLTVDMIPYVKLTCNIESTNPVNNDNGTLTATFNISGAFYQGGFNDGGSGNALSLYYRTTIDGSTGSWEWVNSDDVTVKNNSYLFSIPVTVESGQQLNIEVQAQDNINTVTASLVSKELMPIFDWDRTDFNFNVPVYIKGNEVPTIVESGTFNSGKFYYRKWSDGTAECWGSVSFETAFNVSWGSLGTSGAVNATNVDISYVGFIETPSIIAQLRTRSVGAMLMVPGGNTGTSSSKTNTGVYELVRGATTSAISAFTLCYIIKGRWK